MNDRHMQRVLRCDCGFEAAGAAEDLVVQAQAHARDVHGTEVSAELVLSLARPRSGPSLGTPTEGERA